MMSWEENTTQAIENLLIYASAKGLIETVDMPYFRNLLLDAFQLDAPAGDIVPMADVPPTATALLRTLCDLAVEKGIIEDMTYARDLFSARLMGLLTPSPKEVRAHFQQCVAQNHPEQATEDFYQMCRACDYTRLMQLRKTSVILPIRRRDGWKSPSISPSRRKILRKSRS